MSDLRVLNLDGSAFERGLAHGKTLAPSIAANIETYLARFAASGLSAGAARAEGEIWIGAINDHNQAYGEEMRGVAEGSGIALSDIAMLNARYEITFGLMGDEAKAADQADGCTSFGALPEATFNKHVILGQNWDWLAGVHGHCTVLRVSRDDGPDFICFTEAGIVGGKQGVNEHGIGLVENGLVSDRDGRNKYEKPFHMRCREVLDADSYDLALLPVLATRRVCSANFVIGQGNGDGDGEVINIETSPDATSAHFPTDGLITHANHFTDPRHGPSQMERLSPSTLFRANRLDRLLRKNLGSLDMNHFAAALGDHFAVPNAICRHPDPRQPEPRRTMTNAALVIDLENRSMHIAAGPPCENAFTYYPLQAGAASRAAE